MTKWIFLIGLYGISVATKDTTRKKNYRLRDDVVALKRGSEQHEGDDFLEGVDVDVGQEDMAHLGVGKACTEKTNGTNTFALKEDVETFSWENGVVRYAFAVNYTTEQRYTILDAMNNLAELVNSGSDGGKCIEYTPYDTEKDEGKEFVWFYPGEGCESTVGAPHDNSNRHVSLASGCMERGIVQHELIHVLGFWHEQSRVDRDQYVDIKWENIKNGICENFKMYADPIDDHLGLPYDLRSIMHYKSTAFSKNMEDTIVPKNRMKPDILGQRKKPTEIDLMKVRLRYNCTAKKDPSEYLKLLAVPVGDEVGAAAQRNATASDFIGSGIDWRRN